MEIENFITEIKNIDNIDITRGNIIDMMYDNNDLWILALKSLLIKSTYLYISKSYLLEKLNFMRDNPKSPQIFLDIQGLLIYQALLKNFI